MTENNPLRQAETQEVALYFYRKLVYLLYLEIGSLTPEIHPQVAAKADLKTAFFEREKEKQAAELYHLIEQETDLRKIEQPFRERTGLSLKDIQRAFAEGDWRNKFGAYTSGGPRWERIAALTLELRGQILKNAWEQVEELLFEIKALKTNKGYLVSQFERTERRAPNHRRRRAS